MNKDLGRLQRAIIELVEHSDPEDVGWTLSWLCDHVYASEVSKSQRSALIRAIKSMKLPDGWKFERGWDELQLTNDERFQSRKRHQDR
jgi:hypothetical protein